MAEARLSVLDLSPIASGSTASEALQHTLDLARHTEALGYERYWLAEHHNAGSLASSAPEIMIGQVAAATRTIRVGAGGIMLPNHSPLKVAELFRVLHALFPDRIDLGLGRAAGTDPRTAVALRGSRHALAVDDFPEQMAELVRYLEEDATPRSAFTTSIRAIPLGVPAPVLWILGSTDYGASYAAAHGYGFAFAHHINPGDALHALRAYRAHFRPSARLAEPRTILAVSALCAETEGEADDLRASADLSTLRFASGLRDLPMPSVAEARAHVWDDDARALLEANRGRTFVGTPGHVRHRVLGLAREAQADEVMIMSNIHDHGARKRSYELLATALR